MDARQKLKERIARFGVKFRIRKKLRLANHGSSKEICIINDRPYRVIAGQQLNEGVGIKLRTLSKDYAEA